MPYDLQCICYYIVSEKREAYLDRGQRATSLQDGHRLPCGLELQIGKLICEVGSTGNFTQKLRAFWSRQAASGQGFARTRNMGSGPRDTQEAPHEFKDTQIKGSGCGL